MDKLKTETLQTEDTLPKKESFPSRLGKLLLGKGLGYSVGRRALIFDLAVLALGFLFARCHVIFGAHPLGIALVSVLTKGVWQATLGALIGSFSLGSDGIIYAVSSAIVAVLRVLVTSRDKNGEAGVPFAESLLLRMSVATLGGFVSAVYEVLLAGLSGTSLLFGVSMILIPPALTFVFSGIFCLGISFEEFIFGNSNVFSLRERDEGERYGIIFFQLSACVFLFFVTLSMREIELLGISASYIFVSLVSLVVSKRFGPLRALAVGFTATLGLSASHAVSFALMGLCSGILFGFGTAAGLVGGGAALSLWSSYSEGLLGFLSTLPEYAIAAVLSIPLVKSISAERSEKESRESTREAEEMVGSCALAYRTKHTPSLDALGAALGSIALLIRDETEERTPALADYRRLVHTVLTERCRLCDGAPLCKEHKIPEEIIAEDRIAQRLLSGERCRAEDVNTETAFCQHAGEVAGMINERAAALEREKYKRNKSASSEELELISRLLCEARERDREELVLNSEDTEKCSSALARLGLSSAVIRVFGEARRHIILALEDEVGDRITSSELHAALATALGAPLKAPEYFRRGKMALMECELEKKYRVEYSTATAAGRGNKVSGDTAAGFVSDSGHFYSLISDGEGTGESARNTSVFVLDLLRNVLNLGISTESVLYTLNMMLLRRREECSATVDLFEFDLHTGEATFIKSGAAPSFVKRGDSVFRIRSKTAPIGLMQSIDTEKIRAEILPGDTVIMLSDGIASSPEEAPWLVEMLGRSARRSTRDLSELILAEARRRSPTDDDMTVSVLRIASNASLN